MAASDVVDFYQEQYDESMRLTKMKNQIEFLRTTDVLSRFLPRQRLRVLDVGGGAGVYAEWLAERGHAVTLIDPVPRHVEAASRIQPVNGSIATKLGDARALDEPDGSADVVLMLGPLYHLPERADRVAVWAEAKRVCSPGGMIVAAMISRFASLHDMLIRDKLAEPGIASIVATDLHDGQHRNPGRIEGLFTTAYFHHPDEIVDEASEAGVTVDHVIGVEGMAGFADDFHGRLDNEETRRVLLDLLRSVEEDRSIIGLSNHMLAVASV